MDIITILSFLLTIVGIIVTIVIVYPPRFLRRLVRCIQQIFGFEGVPDIPEYEAAGRRSQADYISQVNEYVDSNPSNLVELGLQQVTNPLKPSASLEQPLIDCICTALSCNGRVYLILPSAKSRPDIEGVGRTALTVRLLDLRLPYTTLIGFDRSRLDNINRLDMRFSESKTWKLIASDMAYLGLSRGQLSVVPTKGEKINFLWDLTRHLFRSTDLSYTYGAHREDPEKRQQLLNLFYLMPCEGLNKFYADIAHAYPVDEIVIVRREQAGQLSLSLLRTLSSGELLKNLEESILISSNQHGSSFWDRSREKLKPSVRYLLDQIAIRDLPTVKELVIYSKDSNVPSFLYAEAVQAINPQSHKALDVDNTELGKLLPGVESYYGALFNSLSLVTQIKMLVTSGEKVFHDGAFWRCLANLNRAFNLEILMLDPDSRYVQELETTAYSDKHKGFLHDEIKKNLEAIRNVKNYLRVNSSPVSIRCWLYRDRPNFRITLVGDERAIIAHYFPGSRTGSDTLFFDLYGSHTRKFVERIKHQYEKVKEVSREDV